MKQRTNLLAYAAVITAMLSISSSPFFVRWADVPGVVSGFYRQAFGLASLLPLFAIGLNPSAQTSAPPSRRAFWLAILAGLFFAGDLAAWNTALLHASATNITLMANTAPIYVGFGALLLFKEQLGGLFWVGLTAAIVGAALIVGADLRQATGFTSWNMLGLAAGFFFACFQLTVNRARHAGMSALRATWLSNISGSVALLALTLALGHALVGFTPTQWVALVGMGIVTQGLGYLTMNYALGKLPAPVVSVSMLGQPVMVAIFSFPLLGEPVTRIQVIGGVFTLAGIYLVNRSRTANRRAAVASTEQLAEST